MYSIKTDLGVAGNGTIDKDLLVNGNAVVKGNLQVDGTVVFADATFTQITVSGDANLADITSTGTSNLVDVNVSGNAVLGDSSTDSLTVQATSTFSAPVVVQQNITQTSGTAALKAVTADSVAVSGQSNLNGNLTMGTGTTAALKAATADSLVVSGATTIGGATTLNGTLGVTGKATFQDVEINGTLSGTYTMDAGNFNSIKVSNLSDLNNVSIKGSTTITGNITGASSTVSVNRLNMQGSDGIIEFAYNDPSRPTDTKSSIEPYQISSQLFVGKSITSSAAEIGVVGGTTGLHAIGNATIDYLKLTGNSTIGDQAQLQVAGRSVFTGLTTVGDLAITGSVSGLTFTDISGTSLTISGNSALQGGVSIGGNVTGSTSSIAKFSTFTVGVGASGNNGIIQFDYNDSSRPSDIKSSIEPYKVSTNDIAANNVVTANATIGNVGGTAGLTALGKSTIDYLKIAGNSTIGTASPQLEVTGKSILGDVEFTGTVTGLTVDVSGQDLTPASVTASGIVKGNTLESVTTTKVGTNLTVGGTAEITGELTAADATFSGDVSVANNTVTIKDLVVTGTTTGVTVAANVDGLDIKPKSVEATESVSSATADVTGALTAGSVSSAGLTVTGATTLAGVTAGATTASSLNVTGASTVAGLTATTLTVPNVTGDVTFADDVTITGTLAPSAIDLSTTDVGAKSLTTTDNVTVGGDLTVSGSFDLSASDVSVKSITATDASTLPTLNSTTATITTLSAGTATVTGAVNAGSLTTSGGLSAATVTSPTIQGAADGAGTVTLASDVVAAKDLTVTGTLKPEGGLDLSAVDITSKSITTTEGATIGGDLSVAGSVDLSAADVTALSFTASDTAKTNTFPILASTTATVGALTVSGASTLAEVSATNVTASGTLGVTGATTLSGVTAGDIDSTSVTASGSVSAASFTSAATTIALAKNTEVTGNLNVTGTFTAGTIDLSTTDVTVKSLESLGDTHVVGDLTVDGSFDLSATNLVASSLASTNDTTVGANLVLTTGNITGAPKISGNTTIAGTLGVTGATSLSTLDTTGLATLNSASVTTTLGVTGETTLSTVSTSGLATLNSATVTNNLTVNGNVTLGNQTTDTVSVAGNSTFAGDVTVNGVFTPAGGLDLSGADISANSITTAAGATIGTTLDVTGASTLAAVTATTVTGSGVGKFGSVTADNGATVTAGNLTVTAGNIVQSGADTATASFKKTSTSNLHVGTLVWDETKYIAEVGGSAHISGDLDVDGTINAQINLTGRDIAPRSIATSQGVTIGTTLEVDGQATLSSAIIGDTGSTNNNLQINGNTTCTGNFTVQGLIIGTLDQSASDVNVKSLTATAAIKGATLESTGAATVGNALTVSAGGATITGNSAVTGNLNVSGTFTAGSFTTSGALRGATVTSDGALTVSAGGAAITGNSTVTGTLGVSGALTAGSISTTGTLGAGAATLSSLTVSGTSGFTGAVTAVDLTSTGLITAKDLTVTGTFTADVSTLTTTAISTKKYDVQAVANQNVTGTWTPDGTSNVYNITVTGALTIGKMPITTGKAASWFIYVTQDSTGHAVSWATGMSQIGDSAVNQTPNSVSICQLVYCGYGDIIDVFIAQRSL